MVSITSISGYLNILRSKFPALLLTVYTVLTSSLYGNTCDGVDTYDNKVGFLIYYPILCLICFVWEGIYSWGQYIKSYPHGSNKEHILFSVVSSFLGTLSFFVITYITASGFPFKCFFSYEIPVAIIIWAISTLVVVVASYFEHLHWSKLVKSSGLL
jgi:hypothetical protein